MTRAFVLAMVRSAVLVLSTAGACLGAQARVPKTTLRPKLTPAQRLERLTTGVRRENPLLPAVMHAFERYLQGIPEDAGMDRVVRRALQRHPNLGKQMLQTAVDNWKTIPAGTKQKLVPAELLNLNSAQTLDMTLLRRAVRNATPRAMSVRSAGASVTGNSELLSALGRTLPYITMVYGVSPTTETGETPRILPGKGMMLDTRNVPADPSKVKVHFLDVDPAKKQLVATATPSNATLSATGVTTLMLTVPANLGYGDYLVQVEVIGASKSNEKWVSYPVPNLKFSPKITSVTPNAQYPLTMAELQNQAGWPTITGTLFTKAIKAVIFEPIAQENLGSYREYGQVGFVSTTQLKLEMPALILPGKYRIALSSPQKKPISNWVNFTVRAPLYRVKFTTIRCADESDPETNSDSIRTIWAIGAPGSLWVKIAGGYNDFGDNVSKYYKPEHQWVYLPDGQKGEVKRYLYVVTSVWEWDSGEDWNERINAMAGIASDVAMEIGGGQVSYGELAHYVVEALQELVILFNGEPNFIGGQGDEVPALAFTADVLQKITAGVPSYEDTLQFRGDDDTGSYLLTYKVFREQP